jgi:hypothetical protein
MLVLELRNGAPATVIIRLREHFFDFYYDA